MRGTSKRIEAVFRLDLSTVWPRCQALYIAGAEEFA
jgi:hypothetical protein